MMPETNNNNNNNSNSNNDIHDDKDVTMIEADDGNDDNDQPKGGPMVIILSLVAAAASKDVEKFRQILREHPDVNAWMDLLIARLLPTTSTSSTSSNEEASSAMMMTSTQQQQQQQQQALLVVGTLAQLDPETYLLPIAKSFASRVAEITRKIPSTPVVVSSALLQVWMQQLTQTSQVAVHSLLLKSLVQAIRVQGPVLAQPAIQELVSVWQFHWSSLLAGTNRETSSIVSVRCAATFVECIVALGDVALSAGQSVGATGLLTAMLQHHQDPLLQLSILDLFPEHFQSTTEIQGATRAWLTSPELVKPIFEMMEDPLLEGPALQCASWISTLGGESSDDAEASSSSSVTTTTTTTTNNLRTRVLQKIEENGVLSSEAERLAVVQALAQMSKSAPSGVLDAIVLKNETLRCAWWDMSRLSSPKLQAAILSSVAQVLTSLAPQSQSSLPASSPEHSDDLSTIGMKLYSFLARDNQASTTSSTDWLFTKYSKSPIPELRIATYAVWSAVAGLGTNGATVLATSSNLWQLLLEGGRESTSDARAAKYEVMETLYKNAQGFLATALQNKLKKLLDMGPHGVQAVHQWDVALE